MKKKNAVLIAIFTILAVIAVIVTLIFAIPKIKSNRTDVPEDASVSKSNKYIELSKRSDDVIFPYIQTDFDNIFYMADLNGNISFFSFKDDTFTAIPETGKINVSVSLCNQSIPATIHYLNVNGKVCGYGIFAATKSTDKKIFIYDYIFFKIINAPTCTSAKYLLLGNVYKDTFFNSEKSFSETWSVDISSGKTTPFFDNDCRSYDMNAMYETDFSVLTDNLINFSNSNGLMFFSSRYHNSTYAPDKKDIFIKNGSKESVKISDIFGTYAHETDKGIVCLKKTDTGFKSVLFTSGKETTIKEFTGDLNTEFAICNDYIYSVKNGILCNLIDGSTKDIGIKAGNISFLRINNDKSKLIVGGKSGNSQYLGFADLSTSSVKFFSGNDLFNSYEDPNFCFCGDYIYHLADGSNSDSVKWCTVNWNDIFAF